MASIPSECFGYSSKNICHSVNCDPNAYCLRSACCQHVGDNRSMDDASCRGFKQVGTTRARAVGCDLHRQLYCTTLGKSFEFPVT